MPRKSGTGAMLAPLNQSVVVRAKSALDVTEAEREEAAAASTVAGGEAAGGSDDAAGQPTETGKEDEGGDAADDDDDGGKFDVPESILGKLWFAFVFPFTGGFHVTVPECEEEEDHWKCYFTFTMCIAWIGALCYLMVAVATEVGCLLSVSPALMGILVLSIGTSVPDAIGSMIASRKGEADMAIANAIGSNVFDILLGLGLPWLLKCAIDKKDIDVKKTDIEVNVAILFGTVWLFLGVLIVNSWKMTKRLGLMLFFLYMVYVVYNIVKASTESTE